MSSNNKIVPYDSDGNDVRVLFQWDKGITLYMEDDFIDQAYEVHFANKQSESAYVVSGTYDNGVLSATVPDALLRESYTIYGFVYEESDSFGRSQLYFEIHVAPRAQPADYVYEDSDEYYTIADAIEEIESLLASVQSYASAAETSADNASTSESNAAASAEAAAASAEAAAESAETATSAAETAAADALESLGFYVGDDGYLYGTEDDE